jgi:alpha-L-fucosidase
MKMAPIWFPVECRFPLGKSFWSNEKIKSLSELLNIYYTSVGRNSALLICAAPDQRGLLTDEAVASLKEFGAAVKTIFGTDLAARMPVKASSVRAGDKEHGPEKAVDRNSKTWWAAKDGAADGWLEVSFPESREFNVIRIEEMATLGQRVQEHLVEVFNAETRTWKPVAKGTTIGYRRIHRFPMVKASGVRLRITKTLAPPMIKSFGVFVDKFSTDPQAE